ncbi:MAG TPA: ABC transporter substrate-binding protein [Streptosporangiaceae bacterium]|jgi:NitT/TauT family transport system substrate-binding protein
MSVSQPRRRVRTGAAAAVAAVAALLAGTLAACGGGSAEGASATTVRLGFFPNLTHASALVGVQKGYFAKALGSGAKLKTATFNAGPAAVQALFSGAVDATYVGPNPAINAWQQSHGKAVKIISGAASGGVSLVVKPGIKSAADLRGKKVATPQLGNTQDVALRYWLKGKGLKTDPQGGGDVHVTPMDNSQTVRSFISGDIAGAWVPEPYASRLLIEGKGKQLVDESSLWPGGKFVITHLLVRTDFLKEHPDQVKALLQGQVQANDFINKHPADAATSVNSELKALSGKTLKPDVLKAAMKHVQFTDDPIASSLKTSADHAVQVGLLKPIDLNGIYDLGPLNDVLKKAGEPAVSGS